MSQPKTSDPSGSPRFPLRGEVKREKPIWTREQFGPWRSDVHVIPITGMRMGYPVLEVNIHWEHGPPLDESLGPTPPAGMAATDLYYVDRQVHDMQLTGQQATELAIELGRRAADLLAEGIKPDLPNLARAIHKRMKG